MFDILANTMEGATAREGSNGAQKHSQDSAQFRQPHQKIHFCSGLFFDSVQKRA